MDKDDLEEQRLTALRTTNFLRILKEQYGDSPKTFEIETGYRQNMVSQIKGRTKVVGPRLGPKLERAMKKPRGYLERSVESTPMMSASRPAPWPFSVSQADFEALSPKIQQDIDESVTRQVLGAQAQELLSKQRRRRST